MLSVFHPNPYDNVVTRWALTRQIVDDFSLNIDRYAGNTNDKAFSNGHFYCDKAVLTSIVACIPYSMTVLLMNAAGDEDGFSAFRYISERFTAGLCLILLLIFLARNLKLKDYSALLALLALGLGSILLPYSTLLYGHVPAAAMLFLSWHYQKRELWVRADLFGAIASAIEFPVTLPFLILLLYRGRQYWSLSRVIRLAGLMILAFIPQLLHNWIAFGKPWTMGYSLETTEEFSGMSRGLFGFTTPSLKSLYLLLLSPERGILFYMPWIAAGFLGFFKGGKFKQVIKKDPLPLITLSYILLFSAYYMPTGGWAYGPRHLIPVIPFFCLGLSRWIHGNRRRLFTAAVLLLPSVILAMIGTFGEIHQPVLPNDTPLPLPQYNIGIVMMMDGHHSLWLFGTPFTILITTSALGLAIAFIAKGKFSWYAPLLLIIWLSAALFSGSRDLGGRIDYYRGVMAEQRQEWSLATLYYAKASSDPTAPDIVREKTEYCRQMERFEQ